MYVYMLPYHPMLLPPMHWAFKSTAIKMLIISRLDVTLPMATTTISLGNKLVRDDTVNVSQHSSVRRLAGGGGGVLASGSPSTTCSVERPH